MARRQKTLQTTPLVPFDLIGPGFKGLNTELNTSFGADPFWASALDNAVWEPAGELSQRKGIIDITVTPATGAPILTGNLEYTQNNGNTIDIAFSNSKVWASIDDCVTWDDITGSLAFTNGERWTGVSFNDSFYITGPGHKISVYNGSGNAVEIATSPVTNGVITAGFGRLWANVDGTSEVEYCALLDGSDWSGTDSGTLDATTAWTDGQDVIVAMTPWGASFVIFGRKTLLVYVDGTGSTVGIDPDNMYIVDTIEGTGAICRDGVVKIGEGDLWYLSNFGVQSVKRAVADKSNPIGAVSLNVRGLITQMVASHAGSEYEIKAVHSAKHGFVFYLFPESNGGIIFDSRAPIDESGAYRAARWTDLPSVYGVVARRDSSLIFGLDAGLAGEYDGYADYVTGGTAVTPELRYASLWLNGDAALATKLKILKEAKLKLYGLGTITGTVRWAVDYRPLEWSATYSAVYNASGGEWGVAEFNVDEFSSGLRARDVFVGLGDEGTVFKIYFTVTNPVTTHRIAVRELVVFAKPGRTA